MANGADGGQNNNLPAWARVVAYIGIPGFLLLYLLGAVPFLRSPLYQFLDFMTAHAQATERLATSVNEVRDDQRELTRRMTTAFRVFCENAAKTDEARNNCKVIDSK